MRGAGSSLRRTATSPSSNTSQAYFKYAQCSVGDLRPISAQARTRCNHKRGARC